MPRYVIKAQAAVDIEMSIEAATGEAARKIFYDQIAVNATLVDTPPKDFDAYDDSLSEVNIFEVSEEDE